MSAIRTISGEKNRRLFVNADFVVWTEGGQNIELDQILEGSGDSETNDAHFWQQVFAKFAPEAKYDFKSVGSKSTLLKLVEYIRDGLEDVYICMDRDYDFMLGKGIDSEWILYTHGYSWENDVLTADCIGIVMRMFCVDNEATQRVVTEAQKDLARTINSLAWLVRLDISLNEIGIDLLPKQRPAQMLSLPKRKKPTLNRPRLKQLITDTKEKVDRPYHGKDISIRKPHDICGKVLIKFLYHLVLSYVTKLKNRKVNFDEESFTRQLINACFQSEDNNVEEVWRYYRSQFGTQEISTR